MDLFALTGYLDGVEFPATKDDIIKHAAVSDMPSDALEALRSGLHSESYASVDAVRAELAEYAGPLS